VGIKPVYKTTSEPSVAESIQFNAGKPSSSSSAIKTGGATGIATGVTEESVLTFPAMSKGQTITVAGLTYTATVANSGAEVAAAFANIASGATTGASTKGTYSGTLLSFNAGRVTGSIDVTFTSTTRFSNVTDITVSSGTTVAGGQIALTPTVSTPTAKQGTSGGGIVLGGSGTFAKSGSLSIVTGGTSSIRSATFTMDDGQILDLNVNSAVSLTSGVVTINKTALDRAGINLLSGGNVSLSQYASSGSAAAFASGDVVALSVSRTLPSLEPMYASDVIINGIPIGASREADDTISPQSGNQIASAIAKAAAINEKTVATGVHASVNPTIMTGAAMSGTGQAKGTLNINGFTTPMINAVLDNPRDSRIAAVNAINFISAQTGIRAVDSLIDSKGIMLVADDGRNVEVTFNTASTDADFSRLTGLKQGVQTGTFSLESMVETPINITTATNGNIHRAGLETVSYDSKTLSTVTTKPRPQVTSVNEIKSLGINDLIINGVAIRPALPTDDTLSVTQSVTSKAQASAIATAAAINASTVKTGVTALPEPVKISGNVTSTALPLTATLAATAGSTQSLYINGKNVPITMSTTQTESERRSAVVAAIHANLGLTGVDAVDNGNGGVSLKAVDGRNVSIWFDSDKVNAGSFGLGSGTVTNTPNGISAISGGSITTTSAATAYASVALQSDKAIKVESGSNGVGAANLGMQNTGAVAQITQIHIESTATVPTVTKTSTYIEIAAGGTNTESLIMSTDATPATAQGVLSYVSGVLYMGNGTSASVMGYVDSTRNGLNGAALRFNFIDSNNQYYNPSNQHYYEVVTPSSRVTWPQAKTLAEGKTLFGLNGYLATITDESERTFVNLKLSTREGWIGASDEQTEGQWKWVTGPEAGTTIPLTFQSWSGGEPNNLGNEDYAYILGSGLWNDYSQVNSVGSYVVEYGGVGFGGYLEPFVTDTDLQSFKDKVVYNDSAIADTAALNINGLNITSAPGSRNATTIATALETAINAQINSGALRNVAVQRQGSTLGIKSIVAGTAFLVSGATTNNAANTISVQELTENKLSTSTSGNKNGKSHFADLGFYEGTFGGEVDEATSKMSPPRTGRLAFQVGANEGQRITIDLADFGKGGPITGEITWDADMDPLPPGAAIPVALPGGPNLQGKPLTRTFISSSAAAQDVLKKLDVAMDKVNQTRATMGAVMNRLDHVINNLTNVSMNLSASRSQIEDAEYAVASTEMVKTQVKQQAATAVLAQANVSQQAVLKLLGN
jgi:flagellin